MPRFTLAGQELEHSQYRTVAASQTTAQISTSGDAAVGDYLSHVVVVPASTAAAGVTVLDGSTAVITVPTFAGTGTGTVCPPPFTLNCGMVATSTKGWVITTGAAISVVAVGRFNR
jgi:hypothetical protein